MPLTPFHLGPALFFGLLVFSAVHLPTFFVANVLVDLEPFFVLFFRLEYPLHGFFHSLLGGSIVAVVLSLVMVKVDERIQNMMRFFKLRQKYSKRSIWLASFLGVYLHIFLDSFLYTDIKPFFPILSNPFYEGSMFTSFEIYNFCVISLFLGIGLYIYKILKHDDLTS